MVVTCNSFGLFGIDSYKVEVEVSISNGANAFDMVGLPDTAVKESKDRVRNAFKNTGFQFPITRITVNLAPADYKKEGPQGCIYRNKGESSNSTLQNERFKLKYK